MKMLSVNEALFAVILVGRVISGKYTLEYNKSKKSLVALGQWWLIRFEFQSPIKNTSLFSSEIFPSNSSKSDRNSFNFESGGR